MLRDLALFRATFAARSSRFICTWFGLQLLFMSSCKALLLRLPAIRSVKLLPAAAPLPVLERYAANVPAENTNELGQASCTWRKL
jgi:hypothetical protein